MRTAEAVRTVDPALLLAELVLRLRHAGVEVHCDRESMAAAHDWMVDLLEALGVPAAGAELSGSDYLLLLCAAAGSRRDGGRSA